MSDHESPSGTSWIWKIFWILLVITTVEVVLGIIKPPILLTSVAGTSVLNLIFIGMTLVKAAYIVQYFMHLKYEVNSCLLYTSPSPRDRTRSRMPSSA